MLFATIEQSLISSVSLAMGVGGAEVQSSRHTVQHAELTWTTSTTLMCEQGEMNYSGTKLRNIFK